MAVGDSRSQAGRDYGVLGGLEEDLGGIAALGYLQGLGERGWVFE